MTPDPTFSEVLKEAKSTGTLAKDMFDNMESRDSYPGTPADIRKIEMEKLFAQVNEQTEAASEEAVRPKRLVDYQMDEERAKLVDAALDIVNMVREKAGLPTLDDLPRAQPGDTGGCVLARAFGMGSAEGNPSVSSSQITMVDPKMKDAAKAIWGTDTIPQNITLDMIIGQFDSGGLLAYDENAPEPVQE